MKMCQDIAGRKTMRSHQMSFWAEVTECVESQEKTQQLKKCTNFKIPQ